MDNLEEPQSGLQRETSPYTVSHTHKMHKIDISRLGRAFFETPKIMPKFDSQGLLFKEGWLSQPGVQPPDQPSFHQHG
jgi:hypothetical protein